MKNSFFNFVAPCPHTIHTSFIKIRLNLAEKKQFLTKKMTEDDNGR